MVEKNEFFVYYNVFLLFVFVTLLLIFHTFSGELKYSTGSVSGLLNIKGQGHEIEFEYFDNNAYFWI
jgi:hypothetical protein